MINLLDTPGHEDFSEDTYRTLTAVDSATDGHRLGQRRRGADASSCCNVCRMRDTPILTFINKLDREVQGADRPARRNRVGARHAVRADHLADRHGQAFPRRLSPLRRHHRLLRPAGREGHGRDHQGPRQPAPRRADRHRRPTNCAPTSNWCAAPRIPSTPTLTCAASRRPVFFGSAVNNFGVQSLLDAVVELAPPPGAQRRGQGRSARGGAERSQVLRLRVQDPGQHGPEAPRPHRLPARLLGPLRPRA